MATQKTGPNPVAFGVKTSRLAPDSAKAIAAVQPGDSPKVGRPVPVAFGVKTSRLCPEGIQGIAGPKPYDSPKHGRGAPATRGMRSRNQDPIGPGEVGASAKAAAGFKQVNHDVGAGVLAEANAAHDHPHSATRRGK